MLSPLSLCVDVCLFCLTNVPEAGYRAASHEVRNQLYCNVYEPGASVVPRSSKATPQTVFLWKKTTSMVVEVQKHVDFDGNFDFAFQLMR